MQSGKVQSVVFTRVFLTRSLSPTPGTAHARLASRHGFEFVFATFAIEIVRRIAPLDGLFLNVLALDALQHSLVVS